MAKQAPKVRGKRPPKTEIRIAPYGKWRKLIRDMNRAERILEGRSTKRAMEDLAETAKNLIIDGIKQGRDSWDDLSDITREFKGSTKPLVDSGMFLASIDTWQEGKRWLAGLVPGSRGSDGQDLEMVGGIQEQGAHIPISDATRKFFAARGFPLRADTKFVRIPPRPWLAPAAAELESHIDDALGPWLEEVFKEFA
jgi:hypothetical protein